MNARFDPASAPTPSDEAFEQAMAKRIVRYAINLNETKRAAENMEARHRERGVGWSDYWRERVAAHNYSNRTNLSPLEYLAECLQEIADDAFDSLPSPEQAAEDEGFREADIRRDAAE